MKFLLLVCWDAEKMDGQSEEVVGGFDILESGSMEEAVEIAAGHPIARMGTIKVRPLWGN